MASYTLWTNQNRAVLEQIERDGFYIAREQYRTPAVSGYSDIMLFLYRWLAENMPIQDVRPKDAKFPVWAALSTSLAYPPTENRVLIKASVPEEYFCCINIVKWTRVSNYCYLPADEEDLKAHHDLLKKYGADDAKAIMTPFYPLIKRKILNSWKRLFEGSIPTDEGIYALMWEMRQEWIEEIIT